MTESMEKDILQEEDAKSRIFRDRVLIVDPDRDFRSTVKSALKGEISGIEIVEASSSEEAWRHISSGSVTIAITPHNTAELPALEILHRMNLHRLGTQLIITSPEIRAPEVVECIKAGAYDFLKRPFSPDQIVHSVTEALNQVRNERIEILERQDKDPISNILGNSLRINAVRELIDQVAATNSTILITGESGTGKEVAARTVHRKSKRKDKPFVIIDCGTIPPGLVESELFGYVSGAFTGASGDKAGLLEQANHGTAFFDEVGEFPLDLQVKLLRVLQDGEVRRVGSDKVSKLDLRIVAATNKVLDQEVRLGRFRQDLFYRLNVVHIEMPPLRDRIEDIEQFINFFLQKYQAEYDHRIKGITHGAMAMLRHYEWPGNIRELEHTMLQIMALHGRKEVIQERDLPMFLERRGRERQVRFLQEALDLRLSIDDYTREFVKMFENQFSEKELANALGITPKTLWQKRRKWGAPKKKKSLS